MLTKIKYLLFYSYLNLVFLLEKLRAFALDIYNPWQDKKVHIILVDWAGYPLIREKKMQSNIIECGLTPLLQNMAYYKAGLQFQISIIISDSSKSKIDQYEKLLSQYSFVSTIHYRKVNSGMDFGAYDYGYQNLKRAGYAGDVIFMNSSSRGPFCHHWLSKYYSLLNRDKRVGLCGINMNNLGLKNGMRAFDPHVQSYFLYTRMTILRMIWPDRFPAHDNPAETNEHKKALIEEGEIEFSRRYLKAGYGLRCRYFPYFFYRSGGPWLMPGGHVRGFRWFSKIVNRI